MLPRGIRNHNPLNVRRSKDQWKGMAEVQTNRTLHEGSQNGDFSMRCTTSRRARQVRTPMVMKMGTGWMSLGVQV